MLPVDPTDRPSSSAAGNGGPGLTRRRVIGTGGGLAVGLALPVFGHRPALAAEPVRVPDLVRLDGIELARAIRTRQVSCTEVMRAYLGHIDAVNPAVNAIVSLQDPYVLLAQARQRDRQLARGQYLGFLHGFPQAIKDLAATKGIRTTLGSPILTNNIPTVDAIFVERMKRSGAIIIGKTNTPEFGLGSQTYNPVFGTTLNAYDTTRTAGGSSGGGGRRLGPADAGRRGRQRFCRVAAQPRRLQQRLRLPAVVRTGAVRPRRRRVRPAGWRRSAAAELTTPAAAGADRPVGLRLDQERRRKPARWDRQLILGTRHPRRGVLLALDHRGASARRRRPTTVPHR
jgi:hypothetical protein